MKQGFTLKVFLKYEIVEKHLHYSTFQIVAGQFLASNGTPNITFVSKHEEHISTPDASCS